MIILPLNPLLTLSTTTTFFWIIMDTKELWNQLWAALYQNGASAKNEEATKNFWDSLTPQQQEFVSPVIVKKVNTGKFVWYDPIRAINENLSRMPTVQHQPTNYRGKPIPSGLQVFSAKYNNEWGMYTQQDIDAYHMTLPEEK